MEKRIGVGGVISTLTGYPLTLPNSIGANLANYKVYGNSTQDGTPTPDNPIDVLSVGDLVTDETNENYGKYQIPVVAKTDNGIENITSIYLDEPLRKIGDYADYIDFESQKVVRQVGIISAERLTSSGWTISNAYAGSVYKGKNYWFSDFNLSPYSSSGNVIVKCNCLSICNENLSSGYKYGTLAFDGDLCLRIFTYKPSSQEEVRSRIIELGIYIVAPLATPTEEDITLPSIPTFEGTCYLSLGTDVEPSDMEISYYMGGE
jgi:hypothetical protein